VKKVLFILSLLIVYSLQLKAVSAAPCYGTHFPDKGKWNIGAQVHVIENRALKKDYGKVSSTQYFYLMSFGVFSWLSIDGKIGVGDITYKPSGGAEKTNFPTNFAGGYGFRIKPYKNEQQKIDFVLGFQHISVHPGSKIVNGAANSVILDDWQGSVLISKDFGLLTPYAGARLTRLDLIQKIEGQSRFRKKSDVDICPVIGADFNFTKQDFLNVEGSFIKETSFSLGFTHNF